VLIESQMFSASFSALTQNNGIDLLLTMLKCFPASLKQQSSQVFKLSVHKFWLNDTCWGNRTTIFLPYLKEYLNMTARYIAHINFFNSNQVSTNKKLSSIRKN
jgi:hypothetical protein